MLYDPRTYLTIWLAWFFVCCFIVWYDENVRSTPNWVDNIVRAFLGSTVIIIIGAIFWGIWA